MEENTLAFTDEFEYVSDMKGGRCYVSSVHQTIPTQYELLHKSNSAWLSSCRSHRSIGGDKIYVHRSCTYSHTITWKSVQPAQVEPDQTTTCLQTEVRARLPCRSLIRKHGRSFRYCRPTPWKWVNMMYVYVYT